MCVFIINTLKGKVEYNKVGEGTPILLVHGGHINCRETIFQKGLDLNKYCFITPSRPGYGNTPLTKINKTPGGTADLFIALLDALKIINVIVMGVSAGGLTALEIAAKYPCRVKKLVLMSAITKKWFSESLIQYKGSKIVFAPGIEKITWFLYRSLFRLRPMAIAKVMFEEISTYRPVEFTEDERNEVKRLTTRMRSKKGFCNDLDQTIKQETLSEITCPTLILHSQYDGAVDLSHPNSAKNDIKNARFLTYNNRWGHLLWIGEEYTPMVNELKKYLE